jgi:hypothetical protein
MKTEAGPISLSRGTQPPSPARLIPSVPPSRIIATHTKHFQDDSVNRGKAGTGHRGIHWDCSGEPDTKKAHPVKDAPFVVGRVSV